MMSIAVSDRIYTAHRIQTKGLKRCGFNFTVSKEHIS